MRRDSLPSPNPGEPPLPERPGRVRRAASILAEAKALRPGDQFNSRHRFESKPSILRSQSFLLTVTSNLRGKGNLQGIGKTIDAQLVRLEVRCALEDLNAVLVAKPTERRMASSSSTRWTRRLSSTLECYGRTSSPKNGRRPIGPNSELRSSWGRLTPYGGHPRVWNAALKS